MRIFIYSVMLLTVLFLSGCFLNKINRTGHGYPGNDHIEDRSDMVNLSLVTYDRSGENFAVVKKKMTTGIPDSRIFVCSSRSGNVLKKWDVDGAVSDAAFSYDGERIITSGINGEIIEWSKEGEILREIDAHREWTQYDGISDDGSLMIAKNRTADRLDIYESANGQRVSSIDLKKNDMLHHRFLRFSPDNSIFITQKTTSDIGVWDVKSGRLIKKDHLFPSSIDSIAISSDNSLLACGSSTSRLYIYNLETLEELHEGKVSDIYSGNVEFVEISPDGKFIACDGLDNTIKIWSVDDKKFIQTLHIKVGITAVAFSSYSNYLADACLEPSIQIWNFETGGLKTTIRGLSKEMTAIAFSRDDRTIYYGMENRIGAVTLKDSEKLFEVLTTRSQLNDLSVSRDGSILTTIAGKEVYRYSTEDGDLEGSHRIIWGAVHDIELSHDGKFLVSCGGDYLVKIWSTDDYKLVRTLPVHEGQVYAVAVSPDDKYIATIDMNNIKIWDFQTDKLIKTIHDQLYQSRCLEFSPDSKWIASASGMMLTVRDIETKTKLAELTTASGSISAISFSSDGKHIAASVQSPDNVVKMWNTETWQFENNFFGHSRSVTGVDFSPDGRTLISSSDDMTVRTWDVESAEEINTINFSRK